MLNKQEKIYNWVIIFNAFFSVLICENHVFMNENVWSGQVVKILRFMPNPIKMVGKKWARPPDHWYDSFCSSGVSLNLGEQVNRKSRWSIFFLGGVREGFWHFELFKWKNLVSIFSFSWFHFRFCTSVARLTEIP